MVGLHDKAAQRAAEQLANQSKQVELKLLNSRRKLEDNKRTNLQLLDPSAKTAPGKLKDDTKKKLHAAGQSGSKVIKPHSVPTKPKHPSKKCTSSTPAPTSHVPASVTVTPDQPLAAVESRVTKSGSKLDLDKEDESSEGEFVPGTVQDRDCDDDDSTLSSHAMSEITTPKGTITVDQHSCILNAALKRHDDIKAAELKQKDAIINNLKKLADSLKKELTNATEGKETSADPLLQAALQETRKALAAALEEKKTVDTAYQNLQKREKTKKDRYTALKKEFDDFKKAAGTKEGSGGNAQDENAAKEIGTLQATVKTLQKQLEDSKKHGKATTKDQAEIGRLKSDLQKSKSALTQSKNELAAVKSKLKKAEGDLKKALDADSSARSTRSGASSNKNMKALKDKIAALKQELKTMTDSNKGLVTRNELLGKKLEEAYKELKKQGKSTSSEMNAQVKKAARDYVKDVVFRTVKLVSSKKPSEVENFMRKVYDGIKHEYGLEDKKSDYYLDFEDFQRIYRGSLLEYLSTQRSNVQQACLKAVVEWYKVHEFVPDFDDIIQVYDVLKREKPAMPTDSSSEEEQEAYDDYVRDMDLLLWYLDKYLPAAAGELTFGKSQRYYKKQTDSIEIRGKKRVLVERQSEAYGWLMFENCHDKWCHVVPQQAKDPKWKVPDWKKDDPDTHPYHDTKYSDPRGGQSAGWKPAARKALNDYCDAIKKLREEDKKAKKGASIYQKCLDLLRKEHGITEDELVPKSRKRKRSKRATEVPEEDFMDVDDESEAPFSVHSEDEASELEDDEGDE